MVGFESVAAGFEGGPGVPCGLAGVSVLGVWVGGLFGFGGLGVLVSGFPPPSSILGVGAVVVSVVVKVGVGVGVKVGVKVNL